MTYYRSETQAQRSVEAHECVSCSCCCPFRHAVRDEETKQISIMCGNAARADLGTPTMGR